MNILHLTHTDINSDSRILKEMESIAKNYNSFHVYGIGVTLDEGTQETGRENEDLYISSIILRTRKWTFLPKLVRHACSLMELTSKMLFRSLKLKPKVVHCHDTLVLPLGVMVKLITNARLVYDAHELESDKNGSTRSLSKLTLFVEKRLWKFVDSLIVVSDSIDRWYMDNVGEKESEVILNSPVLESKKPEEKSRYLREHFSIGDGSKIFLYVGIMGHGRGIDLITEAFIRDGITSSVVFLGYGELSGQLKEMTKEYKNIYVHDAVPHEQVVSVAKSADIGLCLIENVSLSDYYCLPNKLFEYCFAEIPVLASDFPEISLAVEKYDLGKCCDLDSESIYRAIKEFEEMKELPEIDASKLYELSWDAQEEKLKKLYNRLLER